MSDGDQCKGKIKQAEGKGAVRLEGLFQMVGSGRALGIGYLRETWGTRGRRSVTVQAGGTAPAKALRWEHARGVLGPAKGPVWPEEWGGESAKPQGCAVGALAPALGDSRPLQDFEQAHSGVRGREAGGLVRRLLQESTGSRGGGRSPTFRDVFQFSSVQSLSHVQIFVTPWTAAHQASLSITNSQSLLRLMSIEWVMPSNHLILSRPFSSHFQSFPASTTFLMSHFFASGGQSIGASVLASVLPMNIY